MFWTTYGGTMQYSFIAARNDDGERRTTKAIATNRKYFSGDARNTFMIYPSLRSFEHARIKNHGRHFPVFHEQVYFFARFQIGGVDSLPRRGQDMDSAEVVDPVPYRDERAGDPF